MRWRSELRRRLLVLLLVRSLSIWWLLLLGRLTVRMLLLLLRRLTVWVLLRGLAIWVVLLLAEWRLLTERGSLRGCDRGRRLVALRRRRTRTTLGRRGYDTRSCARRWRRGETGGRWVLTCRLLF